MLDIKKIFEDAVVGGDSAGAADVQSTSSGAIGATDILGKCDHSDDGYMKDGCFHIPKNVLKTQKREIFAGKKKKNHKNAYIKGMNIIQEADKQIEKFCNSNLNENEVNPKKILNDLWKEVRSKIKNINDVKKWFLSKKHKLKQYIDNDIKDENIKKLTFKAYNNLEYITTVDQINEASFGKILKIIVCIYLLAVFIPGVLTGFAVGIQHGSIFSAIAGGIAGGIANTWNNVISLLLHLPIIGNIIGMLI